MPHYVITCRGGLLSKQGLKPMGASVEMSEKEAASLPAGTVSLRADSPKVEVVKLNPKIEAVKTAKETKP